MPGPISTRTTGTVTNTPVTHESLPQIPAQATSAQLNDLLTTNWSKLVSGRSPSINVDEGQWLKKLASHPSADAALKNAIADKAANVALTPAAKRAGLDAFITALRSTANTTPTTTTTTTTTTPGGNNRPVNTGTVGNGGTVLDVRLGTTGALGNVSHFKGAVTFDGPWKMNDAALSGAYHGVKADKFGTTDVKLPTGGSFNVRDFHYDLGGGKAGMRLIPVGDGTNIKAADGTSVPGHKVMDDFLRKEMGLGADEPIFALIGYIHPEAHEGDLKALAGEMLKTEGGNTHLGAYVGGGRTTNSPEGYHQNQWNVKGYPANVQIVSLQGVPQGTLNQNALIADTLLNKGVKFPPDYKNDLYKTVDLKTTLEFYKKWVQDDPELRNDPKWHTYCAEHKTIVTNIMLNVPHNEAAFKEIWGAADGAKLFADVKAKYKSITGQDMKETSFEPLWKKEGLTNPASETAFGKGLAWPAETTADIVNDFLNVYASFKDVGGPMVNALLVGFFDTIKSRTGVDMQTYMGLAMPVMNKVLIAEAKTQGINSPADLQKFVQTNTAMLYVALGGKKEDFAPGGTLDQQKLGLVGQMFKGVEASAADIVGKPALSRDAARTWLNAAIEPDLDKARHTTLGSADKPQFFSPPNVTHRIANGIHEHSKFVSIRTVATAVDHSELELKP